MTPAIRVEQLSKRYWINRAGQQAAYRTLRDDLSAWAAAPVRRLQKNRARTPFWALQDVSLEVQPGEVLGIIGRNGAGKSTLLKILSRITKPTSGTVRLRGRMGSLLEVGTGFHPELTGRENIFLSGAVLGMTRQEIKRKFSEIVEFSGVEDFLDTPVKRYSSGMNVRLGFAVAAHLEPEILLVDEVLAVGDAEFQRKCLGKMRDVAASGRTVLLVSHHLASVRNLCSKACLMERGQLREIGAPSTVIAAYLAAAERNEGITEVDLRDWPARYGNGSARIVSASYISHTDSPSDRFERGMTQIVEFETESNIPDHLHVSAVCLTDDGVRVLYLCGHDSPEKPLSVARTPGKVRFEIPQLPLMPGNYSWTLGLHTTAQYPVDVVEGVLPFQVTEPEDSPRPFGITNANGLCSPQSFWTQAEPAP